MSKIVSGKIYDVFCIFGDVLNSYLFPLKYASFTSAYCISHASDNFYYVQCLIPTRTFISFIFHVIKTND